MTGPCLLLALAMVQRPAHPDVVERFTVFQYAWADQMLAARLYVPDRPPGDKLPLVIWLHGRGEAGADNRSQLAWLELVFGTEPQLRDVGALVLAVQSREDRANWTGAELADDDPLARLDAAFDELQRHYAIDPGRIYLAGISQGASACWQYARRHPQRFAGMLPLATCQVSDRAAQELGGLPVWAFQSTADGPAQIQQMQTLIARCDESGWARLTVVPGPTHDCWTAALIDQGAWRWLLRQRRNSRNQDVGWPSLLGGVILLAVAVLLWRLRRRPRMLTTAAKAIT